MKEFIIITAICIAIFTLFIIALVAWPDEEPRKVGGWYKSKKERYREYAKQLSDSGQKVIYYNERTGTIRYRGKDNRVHSESLYRGYRSHWNG